MRILSATKPLLAISLLGICLLAQYACSPDTADRNKNDSDVAVAPDTQASKRKPNILLIIGDDMGNETLSCFEIGKNPARTPSLDTLCNEGVRFTNFWSQPVCSPTRATLLTGRYGFRTGVGDPTGDGKSKGPMPDPPDKPATAPFEVASGPPPGYTAESRPLNWGLPNDEFTLPMAFGDPEEREYAIAAIGKWHLADSKNGWLDHPNQTGFDHFSGLIQGAPESFFAWNKVVDGVVTGATGYTPDDKVSDARAWIEQQGERPWFLWFAFNLVHDPLHLPPETLLRVEHSELNPSVNPMDDPSAWFSAMLEALDSEVEKLLSGLTPEVRDNTYVIFMGDNGTESDWVGQPFRSGRAKGSVYQGGVNVPLIVAGPGVERGASSDALVNSADLFTTIIELAGMSVNEAVPAETTIDSVSILPYLADPDRESIRDWVYAETFERNFDGIEDGDYAMRNHRYKLLRHRGDIQFYDLKNDPYEYIDILKRGIKDEEQIQYNILSQQIADLRASH